MLCPLQCVRSKPCDSTSAIPVCAYPSDTSAPTANTSKYWSISWAMLKVKPYEIPSSVDSSQLHPLVSMNNYNTTLCIQYHVWCFWLPNHGESITLTQPFSYSAPVTNSLECHGIHAIHIDKFIMNFCLRKPFGKRKMNHYSDLYEGPLLHQKTILNELLWLSNGCSGQTSAPAAGPHRLHYRSTISISVPVIPPKATTAPARALLHSHSCGNQAGTMQVICIISVNKVL
jgi:hypothetical protein